MIVVPAGKPRRLYANQLAPRIRCACLGFRFVARFEQQSRYGGDRGSASPRNPSVALESKSSRANLLRRVAFERQQRASWSCVTVVDHADHAFAADFHRRESSSTRVDGVLQQLFDDRCRPLDNFCRAILFATASGNMRIRLIFL